MLGIQFFTISYNSYIELQGMITMKIFYYTSTGNSLHVAREIGKANGAEYQCISMIQAMKNNELEYQDEIIGLVYPCYGAGTPHLVKEFLSKANLKADYFFGVMTYGNIAGAGLNHLAKNALKTAGINFNYLNEILMIDNFLPVFKMEKQIAKLEEKKIDANLEVIIDDINQRKNFIKRNGTVSKLTTASFSKLEDKQIKQGKFGKNFKANEKCTSCKICQKVCPVNNIEIDNGSVPKFNSRCVHCMGCAQNCPQNAIIHKRQRSSVRFRHEKITLKDIINSNNVSE